VGQDHEVLRQEIRDTDSGGSQAVSERSSPFLRNASPAAWLKRATFVLRLPRGERWSDGPLARLARQLHN
jgi:hypothetical protein